MVLRKLKLTNLRNITGKYEFSNGINILIAPNGMGKTNFLEAVHFLSTGKSFRTNYELNCIKKGLVGLKGMVFSRVEGILEDGLGNEVRLEIILEQTENSHGLGCKKTLKADGKRTMLSKFMGNFFAIIFSPNTIDLVTGTPSVRRNELDEFLSLYDEVYFSEISDYKKIIRGRNKLLEKFQEHGGDEKELTFWNAKLVELGSVIIYKRLKFFEKVFPVISKLAPKLFNSKAKDLTINYVSKFIEGKELEEIKKSLSDKIEGNVGKEIGAGVSLYGPHREEFAFHLDGNDLREFGSRGQQRLCAFIFKIAQWELLKRKIQRAPILLLDDLFSELDKEVCVHVQRFLQSLDSQIILTALSKKDFDEEFLKSVQRLTL